MNSVNEIRERLREVADADVAEAAGRYFKTGKGEYGEGDRFMGIRMSVLRRISREYRGLSINDVESLLHSSYHEERMLALLILVEQFRRSDEAGQKRIYDLYLANTRFINNWDLVDLSAKYIVGGYLAKRSRAVLKKLAKSRLLWERRIAVLATFHFIPDGDFEASLELAKLLLRDEEDLIHKAVGWMLREVGNRDREVEEAFLREHYAEMPRTMLRYAIEKFPEPLRKRYLNGKV